MDSSGQPSSAVGRLLVALRMFAPGLLRPTHPAHAAGVWPLGVVARVEDEHRVSPGFRGLTLVTVLSIFALVTLGGVVRVTESGLGCPDWPLCHGKVIPPLDTHTLIEYSHRLMASVAGVLVLATTLLVWRSHRGQPWLFFPATLGSLLLVVQVLLGGFTVLAELPPSIVLAHLATAEALMACVVVVCIVALRGLSPSISVVESRRDRFPILAVGALLAGYALLLTGSYVTVSEATSACGQVWPLCQGQVLPEGLLPTMHMVHRVMALFVGALIVTVLILAWRRRQGRPALGWTAAILGGLFLAQVVVGAMVLWMGFSTGARLAHLAMATLVWIGLAALAVLSYDPPEARLWRVSGA